MIPIMKLNELFDSKVDVKYIGHTKAEFRIGDMNYEAILEEIGNHDYGYENLPKGRFALISFSAYEDNAPETWVITNTGNAPQVFSAMRDIVEHWYDESIAHNFTGIAFTAKEPSRIKLYRVFAESVRREFGYDIVDETYSSVYGEILFAIY